MTSTRRTSAPQSRGSDLNASGPGTQLVLVSPGEGAEAPDPQGRPDSLASLPAQLLSSLGSEGSTHPGLPSPLGPRGSSSWSVP